MVKIKRKEPFGYLVHFTDSCTTIRLNKKESKELLNVDSDITFPDNVTAPEIVHLEITSRCNKNCDYCYIEQGSEELQTDQWKEIIDDLIDNKVFQITLGGGEPFLVKERALTIAEYIENKPLNLALTTNGTLPFKDNRLKLFDQINISHHGSIGEIDSAVESFSKYTDVGINYLLNMNTIDDLIDVVKYCKKRDLELLILSYKPVNNDWKNMFSPETVHSIAKEISDYNVKVAIDKMTERKCTGAQRFVTVDPTGEVYPCSYVRKSMGNLTEERFSEVWDKKYKPDCPFLI